MAVKLKFLGAARTVTGSSHLITGGESEVILDAGLFQGHRDESYRLNTTLEYNPHTIDALIISHAHIDHCGNLPTLIKKGLRAKIFATTPTKDLCKLMLEDSGTIQEEDIKYVNKINRRMDLPLRKPLYNMKEASKAAKKIHPVSYKQKLCVAKNICAILYDAGHILGSAIISLEIKDGLKVVRLGYAVDLGRKGLPMLNDPSVLKGLDYLILESTYGNKFHSPIEEAKGKLKDAVSRTVARKGKIIIPSFSLERAQEVIYFLSELVKEKAIPPIPIYVDSPLATDITDAFQFHSNYMDSQTRHAIDKGDNPFDFLSLKYIRNQKESKALNTDKRPMIIIAGSGMCESGRVLHHLQNNIEDSRNTILIVGYMAQDTLGRRIVDRIPFVRIFGIEYQLNAEVVIINAFSGHADRNDLLEFVAQCLPLKRIFLVHGELSQTQSLAEALTQKGLDVYIPVKNEEVLLD